MERGSQGQQTSRAVADSREETRRAEEGSEGRIGAGDIVAERGTDRDTNRDTRPETRRARIDLGPGLRRVGSM